MQKAKILESLFPGARHAVLSVTFLEPSRWFARNALAALASTQPRSLDADLDCLIAAAILQERGGSGGREVRANTDCPFFAEIQSIVTKAKLEATGPSCAILVVEDEPATLKITRILLESWGYQVHSAPNGLEALALFQRHKETIRLVLTDIVMPGMSGVQLAERLARLDGDVRIVYMSGYHNEGLKQFGKRPITFLAKPFSPERLARTVREELEKP
jgi:CheY-like chemotaxis protein